MSVLLKAVESATQIQVYNPEAIGQLKAEFEHLERCKSDLLDIERDAYNWATKRQGEILLAQLQSQYRQMSLKPLTWRDKKGYPKLAVFTLTSSIFRLAANGHYVSKYDLIHDTVLPSQLYKCYEDVRKIGGKQLYDGECKWTIWCRFSGLIPHRVRQKICQAQVLFGENIFIIAEPKNWEGDKINDDPLVVGYEPRASKNSLWLIAEFDVTPVEEAMKFFPRGDGR